MIRTALLAATALTFAMPAVAADTTATPASAGISGLGIRNIGSAAMSGRIAALAARVEDDGKVTIFVGAASGGVWKSDDGGTSFTPKFDKQPVQSIGAVALDPTNKQTVWVGTGESWTRNSVSVGNGIYKSTDGGDNWTLMGLPNVERITKIVVHPTNGNIVYACAPGALWSDSPDRGLYKTSDGGKTWTQILKGPNLSTGCSGVSLDPSNPERLIAGLWDFRRKGWTFRSGGEGPDAPSGSAMAISEDGGKTWKMLDATTKGLPKGPWGRIEVVHAPSMPNRVYAVIEHAKTALYVSEDGGKSWEARDSSRNMVWRPFYFQKLVVDPTNADRVFKMNLRVIVSDNAGKSFSDTAGGSHADWHDVWVNPKNPKHLIGADDGGMWISYDGGSKWWHSRNLPISQFYHVAIDDKDPYQVYGGLQDNSSWVGDSEYPGGITNHRWENLYGGDGFWVLPDPASPDHVYAEYQGGNIAWINRKTLEQKAIQPKAGYKEKLRFNWNTPMALSPHDKSVLYLGSQYLHRTRDHGNTWERISPDLSTNNPAKQQQEKSGGITVDNSSAEMHTTIYSISESPKAADTIWVGTDDGNVQVTTNGGGTWTNVTKALKLGADNWVSWVEASQHDAATAYVAVDRHVFGDMAPHIFVTHDGGKSFARIAGPTTAGIRGYAHVIKEDRVDAKILYAGTEFGMFISRNGGANWEEFRPGNFPAVAVRDIVQSKKGDDACHAWPRHLGDRRRVAPAQPDAHGGGLQRHAGGLGAGGTTHPGQWWLVGRRCQFRGGQSRRWRGDHLLPEGPPRYRPHEDGNHRPRWPVGRRTAHIQAQGSQPRGLVDAHQAAVGATGGQPCRQLRCGPARAAGPVQGAADQGRRGDGSAAHACHRSTGQLHGRRPQGTICQRRTGESIVPAHDRPDLWPGRARPRCQRRRK
jgi:photosystem II stability/assembly factor-like uncharacterized protein